MAVSPAGLIVPDETVELAVPWFYPSAATIAEQERMLRARFFLVKIAGNGQAWRCKGCKGQHRYLTLRCIERPFSGLTRGLYAYWKTLGAYGGERYLSPSERSRMTALSELFGPAKGIPDLASAHPITAKTLGIGSNEADYGAVTLASPTLTASALGVVEIVDREKARRLCERINATGLKPAFRIEGVDDGDLSRPV